VNTTEYPSKMNTTSLRNVATPTAGEVARLYERYRLEVYHLALRYGRGRRSWAEDITHDIFLTLLRDELDLADKESLSGWFYRVTTRRCLNKLRHERLVGAVLGRWLFGEPNAADDAVRDPERELVAKSELNVALDIVNSLPDKQRVAFYMFYVDGKEQVEIAETLGHSKGYVSKLLTRACAALQQQGWAP
jgi:RNA polymerase sigma-70 factor, ECF subfamily